MDELPKSDDLKCEVKLMNREIMEKIAFTDPPTPMLSLLIFHIIHCKVKAISRTGMQEDNSLKCFIQTLLFISSHEIEYLEHIYFIFNMNCIFVNAFVQNNKVTNFVASHFYMKMDINY